MGVHGSAKLKLSQAMTPEMELAAIDARLKELKEQEKEYSEAGAWFITNGFEYKRSLYKVNPTEAEKEEIKRREHAGESLMQRGYKYNYKAQDTRDEIIKLEDRRREVYANTAAGIRAPQRKQEGRPHLRDLSKSEQDCKQKLCNGKTRERLTESKENVEEKLILSSAVATLRGDRKQEELLISWTLAIEIWLITILKNSQRLLTLA